MSYWIIQCHRKQTNLFDELVLFRPNTSEFSMGDLIAFKGSENDSAPFDPNEYQAEWRGDRHYLDFAFSNTYNTTCQYPRFWDESGYTITESTNPNIAQLKGCYDSEFDQVSEWNITRDNNTAKYFSTATLELLLLSQYGSVNVLLLVLSKTASESGFLLSARRSSAFRAF